MRILTLSLALLLAGGAFAKEGGSEAPAPSRNGGVSLAYDAAACKTCSDQNASCSQTCKGVDAACIGGCDKQLRACILRGCW